MLARKPDICKNCGKGFIKFDGKKHNFCSDECKKENKRKSGDKRQ